MWKLVVINRWMLLEMMPASRAAAAATALLRSHVVIRPVLGIGTMFRLQKSISL